MNGPFVFVEFTDYAEMPLSVRLDTIVAIGDSEGGGARLYLGDDFVFLVRETHERVLSLMQEAVERAHRD